MKSYCETSSWESALSHSTDTRSPDPELMSVGGVGNAAAGVVTGCGVGAGVPNSTGVSKGISGSSTVALGCTYITEAEETGKKSMTIVCVTVWPSCETVA